MTFRLPIGVYRVQSVLIFAVFIIFVFNALGLTDFRFMLGGRIAINPQVFSDLLSGNIGAQLLQLDFVVFLVVGASLALLLPTLPPIGASLITLSAMLPPFYIAWAYPVPPPLIPLEYTLLAILILFSVNVLSSYFVETHEKQKLIAAFGHYVPPALVEEISRRP